MNKDNIDYTDRWIELFQKALSLKPHSFELFRFCVGYYGTDEERYKKGIMVWDMLHHPAQAMNDTNITRDMT